MVFVDGPPHRSVPQASVIKGSDPYDNPYDTADSNPGVPKKMNRDSGQVRKTGQSE
jgi:hypothetical protein